MTVSTLTRSYGALDRALVQLERSLRVLMAQPHPHRPSPAHALPEPALSERERERAIGLMRVNHAGEVAAQGLYHGQSLLAAQGDVSAQLEAASREEQDHLAWCDQRLGELGGRPSRLSPLWYGGAFGLGVAAGLLGDRASLGFVAETERQVVAHLGRHLARLPHADTKSRRILEVMQADEARHGAEAGAAGGVALPAPVRAAMGLTARVMTTSAYYV